MNILIYGNCITEQCLQRRKNDSYFSAAGRKKVIALSEAMEELGHQVDICSVSYSKYTHPVFIEQLSEHIRIIHAPTIGFYGKLSFFKRTIGVLFNIFWLLRQVKHYHLILFWNYHIEFSLPALLAKWLFGHPIVMDYEDGLFLDKGYQGVLYRFWEKTVYHTASGFILVNDGLQSRLNRFLFKPPLSVTIHGFIDKKLLRNHQESQKGPVKRLVFSGNFHTGFGFHELLQYVDHLDTDIRFDITGKASSLEEEQLQRHICNRPHIRYHGFLSEKPFTAIIDNADAFVLLNDPSSPHAQTNFPSKFFDYLSRNRFVLTTHNPLLKPYYHLKNVIVMESFPEIIRHLHLITADRMTDYREIESIAQDMINRLNSLLETIYNAVGRDPECSSDREALQSGFEVRHF